MKPIERILCAVDFSPLSIEALKAAFALAEKVRARVSALHVVSQTPFEGHFYGPAAVDFIQQIERETSEELLSQIHALKRDDQEVSAFIKSGSPFLEVIRTARQLKSNFLFMGGHEKGELYRVLLGSVAENILRKSEWPVWVVKKEFTPLKKIFILTDLSEHSRPGFNLGLFLARIFSASVHLVHVFDPPTLPAFLKIRKIERELKMKEMIREEFQKWVEEARISKLEMNSTLLEGNVRLKVLEILEQEGADLLVLSTHGQSGSFHKYIGSNAAYLSRHAPCSIALTHPESFRLKEIEHAPA